MVGLLDASIWLTYVIGMDPVYWHSLTASMKCVIFLGNPKLNHQSIRFYLPFALLIFVSFAITTLAGLNEPRTQLQLGGFLLSLGATVLLLNSKDGLRDYLTAVAGASSIAALTYLFFLLTGMIPDHFGRYLFFGGSHPNLGGEILAFSVMAAAYTFNRRWFIAHWIIATVSISYMQSRAGLVVCFLTLGIYLWQWIASSPHRRTVVIALTGAVGLLAILLLDKARLAFRSMLLLDDTHRGSSSGFVGREERWQTALNLFSDNPIIGSGFSIYQKDGILSAHNYFLTGLSQMGGIAILLFAYLLVCWAIFYKRSKKLFLTFSPSVVLMVFNDRFIDMNLYPFALYAITFVACSMITEKENNRNLVKSR